MTLDLNMGYYTIYIFPRIRDPTTIVAEFGKFRYIRVLMGLCAFGDIFQYKLDDLLSDIERFKTYINDILVLNKVDYTNTS